jgi:hypothetical protein
MNKKIGEKTYEKNKYHIFYLIKGQGALKLKSDKDLKEAYVNYSAPVCYGEQIPLLIKLENNTSPNVSYSIIDDKNEPNKLLKFNITNFKKEDPVWIYFSYWVLIKVRLYKDFPKQTLLPKNEEIPEEIKKWLSPTESIQADNFFIKIRAKILKRFENNLFENTKKVAFFACYQRPILSKIRSIIEHKIILRDLLLPKKYYTGMMDAVSGLFFGGMCAEKANLGVALLRSMGIPSRILIVNPLHYFVLNKTDWTDSMHYIIEIYVPKYGWVRVHPGKVPHSTKNDLIIKIAYPEDENEAGNGFSYYGGMMPWFWFSDKNIKLDFPSDIYTYYKKPKSSGIPIAFRQILNKLKVDNKTSNEFFQNSKVFWDKYLEKFKNIDNLSHNEKHQKTIKLQEEVVALIVSSKVKECNKILSKNFI